MAEETIISWSPANMITITLMAAVGFALLSVAVQVYRSYQSQQAA
jgi:hypothetical protein